MYSYLNYVYRLQVELRFIEKLTFGSSANFEIRPCDLFVLYAKLNFMKSCSFLNSK